MDERRVVVDAATRRFVVRKPTCDTVTRAVALYASEIRVAIKSYRERTDWGDADLVGAFLPLFDDADRLAVVLPTCVDLVGGAPGDLESAIGTSKPLRLQLLRSVLHVCDIERIIGTLSLAAAVGADDAEPDDDEEDRNASAPTPTEVMIDYVALRYGLTPLAVMSWPYEAVCSVVGWQVGAPEGEPRSEGVGRFSLQQLNAMGGAFRTASIKDPRVN